MKNWKLVIVALLLQSIGAIAIAQDIEYGDYDWSPDIDHEVPEDREQHSRIVLKDKTAIEYSLEGDNFYQYKLSHTIVYVQDDLGVEWHNKMYLVAEEDADILMQKARVINSNGQVLVFDENDIKEGFDEQSGITYQYFALEGLDVGSFVESIHLIKSYADYNGSLVQIGSEVLKRNVEFELISADHLFFDFASLNGLDSIRLDTATSVKNHWRLHMNEIPAFEEEALCYTDANLPSLVYKLDQNTAHFKKNLSSYNETVKTIFNYVYHMQTKSDDKALSGLIKSLNFKSDMSDTEKVLLLENHVKQNYAVLGYVPPEYETISALIEHNASGENGFLKLYANAFKALEIEHQIVLTTDRTSMHFDPDFDAACYLHSVVIYLPGLDLYLSPEAGHLRLGYIPWEYTNNYGLFISSKTVGVLETAIGKVQYIEALDHNSSQLNHRIIVDLSKDVFEPEIEFKVELSGHIGSFIQNVYGSLSTSEQATIDEGLKQFITANDNTIDMEVINGEADLFGQEPLILLSHTRTSEFTAKAGNKVLLKIGELIGEQTEMYNEKPRKNPVDNDFNRSFFRTIKVILPDGYALTNTERLDMDISTPDASAIFKSTHEIANGMLTIHIDEYYDRVTYSVEEFEALKKVINAAADFNKVVLYLERN